MATKPKSEDVLADLEFDLEPDRPDAVEIDAGVNYVWPEGEAFPVIDGVRPTVVTEFMGQLRTRGDYPAGQPEGMIVHHLAGRDGARRAMRVALLKASYKYDTIGGDGTVCLAGDYTRWGYHAGSSFHPVLGHSVSRRLHGVEVTSAGLLKRFRGKYYTYWDRDHRHPLPANEFRYVKKGQWSNVTTSGCYHRFTALQEQSLIWLLRYYRILFGKQFRFCLGHDEVAVTYPKKDGKPAPFMVSKRNFAEYLGRKNDPGGSLSMSMDALREVVDMEKGW